MWSTALHVQATCAGGMCRHDVAPCPSTQGPMTRSTLGQFKHERERNGRGTLGSAHVANQEPVRVMSAYCACHGHAYHACHGPCIPCLPWPMHIYCACHDPCILCLSWPMHIYCACHGPCILCLPWPCIPCLPWPMHTMPAMAHAYILCL